MVKPRIFISSTYYDLKHIRNNLNSFIRQFGYEPVLFEKGDIPFKHDKPLDESCYKEIENCHMQILIIGGRYGSPDSEFTAKIKPKEINKMYEEYNSVTKKEYMKAKEKNIPIYIFVEKGVYTEYDTYKQNRENDSIKYVHVDSINIFKLLDGILAEQTGHYVKDFEKIEDITDWLKDQWAGLFTDLLTKKSIDVQFITLSSQVKELQSITGTLKEYTEAIMRKIQPKDFASLIKKEDEKIKYLKGSQIKKTDMLDYLIHNYKLKISDIKAYISLESSSSLEDFLKRIGLKDEYISEFLRRHQKPAQRDFDELKSEFKF